MTKDLNNLTLSELHETLEQEQIVKDSEALRYILEDSRGRWFLMRLFDRCHMLSTTYPDEGQVNQMLIWEGERRVALNLLSNINLLGPDAVNARQLAEREYTSYNANAAYLLRLAENNEKGDSNNGLNF